MKSDIAHFLDSRIEAIIRDLRKTNSEYAFAAERSKELYLNIEPVIHRERDITLCAADRLDFQEYFKQAFIVTAIEQQALYRQGYLDCVGLLSKLGILT
ncbi:hypothetical protein [Candidatus Soleaferrea massiliensis]|uniref:hypothetical protein n=1 Tax=Candidatus Soleaferrea massiliensis TaxID=1470354 RepID=UPI00058F62B3|nr:hypothetical protein [Candidatus Soleaferrea massiliensis]